GSALDTKSLVNRVDVYESLRINSAQVERVVKLRTRLRRREEAGMGKRRSRPRPTDAELAILRVLWRRGPSTVRDVHDELGGDAATVYTTVLKMLQIMHDKGLVSREEAGRAHVYQAAQSREQTQAGLVSDLIQRAFEGSAQQLVMRALSASNA